MKRIFIFSLVISILIGSMYDSFARAGKGRSSGFRQYDTQQFNYKKQQDLNKQTQTPSYQQTQPVYTRQPQPQAVSKPSFLNSSWFKWLIGGMIFGALLSFLLGHGFNFGMPGLLEILIIVAVVYLLIRAFRKQQNPEYATQTSINNQPYMYETNESYTSSTIPSINEELILNLAKNAFVDIQKAWSEGDLSKVKNFMTDRMYNYLELQLKELKEKGLRNIIDNINIKDMQIVHVEEEKDHKVVIVQITASGIDYTVDKNGNVVEGDPVNPVEFSEYWAFVGKALDWRLDDIKQINDI